MIEPVAATALILSILALIAYYLQPKQPHHQRHYYHQVARARVMTDPQRRSRGDDVEGADIRGREGEGEVYERENEEGEGGDEGRGVVEIEVRELGMIGRAVVGSRLVEEGGGERLGAKRTGGFHGCRAESVYAGTNLGSEDISLQESDMRTDTASQRPSRPIIRLTIPASDTSSTVVSSHDAEHDTKFENLGDNTLDQQRRQRVRFDEALRMHSYGGSQYVGRVVDRDV